MPSRAARRCHRCTTLPAMAKTYRPYVPEQDLLLPPSLREWLPEEHLAFFVSDLIDQLDLSAITTGYEDEERGYPPYHPVMLTKVLVYAYCVGVFASRKIQRRLVEDVAFRVLAAGNHPDFRTIADFRKTHLTALRGFFEQVLHLARELGAPRVGRVALDGSKIKANASKRKQKHCERPGPCPRGPLPKTATIVDRMSRKLHTKAGAAVYAARKGIVEPVIGQIKHARGFRQFLLRGFEKVQGEWSLVCTTHNILKLYRFYG